MASDGVERQRLRAVIQHSAVAVLVTFDEHGIAAGRPMLPLLIANDPHIYFLTHNGSRKVAQIAARPRVALTIEASGTYLFITGRADVSGSPELIQALWHPSYRAWFPDGRADRDASVVRVRVERVDYWEPPRSRLTRVVQAARAIVTGRAVENEMKSVDGL
jgi:general stress protein 26